MGAAFGGGVLPPGTRPQAWHRVDPAPGTCAAALPSARTVARVDGHRDCAAPQEMEAGGGESRAAGRESPSGEADHTAANSSSPMRP